MSKEIQKVEPRKLPTLNDLYSLETLDALETSAELALLLNSEPMPKWLLVDDGKSKQPVMYNPKEHKGLIPYIPIDRIKWLLSRIFVEWQIDVKQSYQLWNGVGVAVRIHYRHPSGEWRFTDGVGAAPVQFKSGTSPLPENLNQKSIQKALPSAESFAVKNAAKKLGRLFGARLTKQDEEMDYDFSGRFESLPISEEELISLESEIASSKIDRSDLMEFLKTSYNVNSLSDLNRTQHQVTRMRITSANNHNGNS